MLTLSLKPHMPTLTQRHLEGLEFFQKGGAVVQVGTLKVCDLAVAEMC